jgi:hypothetical protein
MLIYPNRGKIAKAQHAADIHFRDTGLSAMPATDGSSPPSQSMAGNAGSVFSLFF